MAPSSPGLGPLLNRGQEGDCRREGREHPGLGRGSSLHTQGVHQWGGLWGRSRGASVPPARSSTGAKPLPVQGASEHECAAARGRCNVTVRAPWSEITETLKTVAAACSTREGSCVTARRTCPGRAGGSRGPGTWSLWPALGPMMTPAPLCGPLSLNTSAPAWQGSHPQRAGGPKAPSRLLLPDLAPPRGLSFQSPLCLLSWDRPRLGSLG